MAELAPDAVLFKLTQAACRGCDGRCLGRLIGQRSERLIRVPRQHLEGATDKLVVGGRVSLSVAPVTLIGLSSLAYLLPVVLMLLLSVVCFRFFSRADAAVAVAAALGFALGLAVCKLTSRRVSQGCRPRIRLSSR